MPELAITSAYLATNPLDRVGGEVVKSDGTFRAVRIFSLLSFALFSSCDPQTPLVSRTDEVAFYLVLAVNPPLPTQPQPRAIVGNSGMPPHIEYETATRFLMWRSVDSATFNWQPDNPRVFGDGNYALPELGSSAGLGWRDLSPGQMYSIVVETQGRVIRGNTTIPNAPQLRVMTAMGAYQLVWTPIVGAGGYRIGDTGELTMDTTFTIGNTLPIGRTYFVTALDMNLYRYLKDNTLTHSGISGALGLFGASNTASIEVSDGLAEIVRPSSTILSPLK